MLEQKYNTLILKVFLDTKVYDLPKVHKNVSFSLSLMHICKNLGSTAHLIRISLSVSFTYM
jgi:hypothetical protein